jgi:hypothetical protein
LCTIESFDSILIAILRCGIFVSLFLMIFFCLYYCDLFVVSLYYLFYLQLEGVSYSYNANTQQYSFNAATFRDHWECLYPAGTTDLTDTSWKSFSYAVSSETRFGFK